MTKDSSCTTEITLYFEPVIEPSSSSSRIISISTGSRLRPGDVVSARISDVLTGNRFRIVLNGRTLTAESRLTLRKGQMIRARVEQSGSGTVLRLMDSGRVPARSHGRAPDASPRQILTAAFLKAALALPEEADMQRMSALLDRSRGRKLRLARLQADLVSRGADPSADFLEAVEELLSGDEGDNGRTGGGRKRWPGIPAPPELSSDLQDETTEPLLQLLNGSPGKGRNWTYHRFERVVGDRRYLMTMKIRHGREPLLALTVRDAGRTMEFILNGLNPVRMSVFSDSETEPDAAKWTLFRQRLSLMKIHVDDTISSMEASDGFEGA